MRFCQEHAKENRKQDAHLEKSHYVFHPMSASVRCAASAYRTAVRATSAGLSVTRASRPRYSALAVYFAASRRSTANKSASLSATSGVLVVGVALRHAVTVGLLPAILAASVCEISSVGVAG